MLAPPATPAPIKPDCTTPEPKGDQRNRLVELDLQFHGGDGCGRLPSDYNSPFGGVTQYGYLGVHLFFLISGFVIFWSAQGRTARAFVASRFARLYPAFVLCMAVTVGATMLWGMAAPSLPRLAANATMVSGYLHQPYIDEVYWTLQIELKFYFLVLTLLLLRQMPNAEMWLRGWLLACVADAILPLPGVVRSVIIAPYGPLFIAGACFLLIRKRGSTRMRMGAILICLILGAKDAIHSARDSGSGARATPWYRSSRLCSS